MFINPVRIECVQLKGEFLFEILAAFCVPVLEEEVGVARFHFGVYIINITDW